MSKTCFILPGLDAGGVENYLLRFLRHFHEDAWSVLVRSNRHGELYTEYQGVNAKVHFQPVGYFNILNWFKVYRYFMDEKFTTVCDFGGNFAGPTMLLARLAGVRNRIAFYRRSSNAFSETAIKLLYNSWMNRMVVAHATRILSNSQHAVDFFFPQNKGDRRFRVIPNGVDQSAYRKDFDSTDARSEFKLPPDRFIVGHIGRFDWSKNHETIFKVARTLKSLNSTAIFVFAGMGTDSEVFLDKLKAYDIQDVCVGLGLQDDLPLLYQSMDVFYFPSVTEGQPNALIEAMMAGLPVLASDIPPIKEMMPQEMHGLLFDPLNDERASIEILRCMEQPSYRQQYVVNNEFLEKFDPDRNFELFREELVRE